MTREEFKQKLQELLGDRYVDGSNETELNKLKDNQDGKFTR